jgi:hypothetical protein
LFHHRADAFAAPGVQQPDHRRVGDAGVLVQAGVQAGVLVQQVLDLLRGDVLALADAATPYSSPPPSSISSRPGCAGGCG